MSAKAPSPVAVGSKNRRTVIMAAAGVALIALLLVAKMFLFGGGSSSTSAPITPNAGATAAVNGQRAASVAPAVNPGPVPNATRDIFRPLR